MITPLVEQWISLFYDMLQAASVGFEDTLPALIDEQFERIADGYILSTLQDREAMRASLPLEYSITLLSVGDRQILWGLKSRDPRHLRYALASHSMEDFRLDPRENILRLIEIWNAFEDLTITPNDNFLACASLSSPKAAEKIKSFVEEPSWVKQKKIRKLKPLTQ